jgi:NAD(P)-dependent dehydrogenase (short-subunit alcohol dehydrogenase family)
MVSMSTEQNTNIREHPMSEQTQTAVVTGASRGFGRGIAAALVGAGYTVVGIARGEEQLRAVGKELGERFVPVVGDATDEAVAQRVIREYRPGLLVLNAGVVPHMAPIHEQTWETFGRNWNADTKHAFAWITTALREPLAPGSAVVAVSSAAALAGSPLSGGYASAKAAVRYLRGYAAEESERGELGIRFVAVLPNLSPSTDLGAVGVAGYAARQGVDPETLTARMQPVLTPELAGKAVLDLAADADTGPEYRLDGAGLHPIG